jgi:hypothetical protein
MVRLTSATQLALGNNVRAQALPYGVPGESYPMLGITVGLDFATSQALDYPPDREVVIATQLLDSDLSNAEICIQRARPSGQFEFRCFVAPAPTSR